MVVERTARGSGNRQYARILVGYDGSENSKRALRKAIELAKVLGSEVRLVAVEDTIGYVPSLAGVVYPPNMRRSLLEQGNALLKEAMNLMREAGITNVSGSVKEGSPADVILAYASDYKADLIVLGRRGIRGIERFLMGSVSSAVVSHSECDVLVVK
jgi:nucleotide-binding universal stress UspA family protein